MAIPYTGNSSIAAVGKDTNGTEITKSGSSASSSNHATEKQQDPSTAFNAQGIREYIARLTQPEPDDKCWINTGYGGYNRAIVITQSCRYAVGSCLPNCVGYVWGRVYECSKQYGTELPTVATLSIDDANTFYDHRKNANNAWARGDYPRLGAVICYDGGKHGHVGMVEKINFKADGTIENIKIGEGAWLQYVFFLNTKYPSNNYRYNSSYETQGFIYPPYCSLFSLDGTSQQLRLETIVIVSDALAKYVQTWVSDYDKENPGFDPSEPPTGDVIGDMGDSEGNPVVAGNTVKVIGPGNTSKTGKGKEITQIGMEYVVKSIHPNFPYPYRLGPENGRGEGYWSKSAVLGLTE